MRKIAAPYIFPVSSAPIKNGIVAIEDDGTIIEIIDTKGTLSEIADLEYYNGLIVPGFINCHCHLELSYLKGKINNIQGLPDFISKFLRLRDQKPDNLLRIIEDADKQMQSEGVVAVGDISNGNTSFSVKAKSKISYHTFIEIFNTDPSFAATELKKGKALLAELTRNNLQGSIVPHAPYTMSGALMELIKNEHNNNKVIYSIHNQESAFENEMFKSRTGKLFDFFSRGMDMTSFNATGKSSLQSMVPYFPANNNILLIHNIYTENSDIEVIKNFSNNLTFVLCPKSNMLIEQRLPDIDNFINSGISIALGTDSLASNNSLSLLEEMLLVINNYPVLSFETILKWATLNGAKALGNEKMLGSIQKGKKPGLNLITAFDFQKMLPTPESKINVLL